MRFLAFSSSLISCAILSTFAPAIGADVVLDSPLTNLVVRGGAANNGLVPADGYFRYVDKAHNEETTWSIDPVLINAAGAVSVLSNGSTGGLTNPVDVAGAAESTAAFGDINTTASTVLLGGIARTTFTFTASSSMNGAVFVFYAENDLFSAADSALFTGSIAEGNLRLFQFDFGGSDFFVQMQENSASNATLTSFGCQNWTGFGSSIESGDLSVLSTDGNNFVNTGDLGLAMAWNLSGTSASVTVDYFTTNEVPEPATFAVALPLLFLRRRR